jgi:hypothetical protein
MRAIAPIGTGTLGIRTRLTDAAITVGGEGKSRQLTAGGGLLRMPAILGNFLQTGERIDRRG